MRNDPLSKEDVTKELMPRLFELNAGKELGTEVSKRPFSDTVGYEDVIFILHWAWKHFEDVYTANELADSLDPNNVSEGVFYGAQASVVRSLRLYQQLTPHKRLRLAQRYLFLESTRRKNPYDPPISE